MTASAPCGFSCFKNDIPYFFTQTVNQAERHTPVGGSPGENDKGDYYPPPGGGTHLYKLYKYVRRQRVWFLSLSGEWGIDLDHFGLK